MWRIKHLLFVFLGINILPAQSVLNGFGLGMGQPGADAASIAVSSSGLLPAFQSGVSLNNPSTWHALQFTFLSTMYGGQQVNLDKNNIINGKSELNQVQLIIPIKQSYSFGFGFRPYLDQYGSFIGKETNFITEDDTLLLQHRSARYGGISAINTAFGYVLNDKESIALTFDFLFGSSRRETILAIDNVDYIFKNRNVYSGTLVKLFLQSRRFAIKKSTVNTFLVIGFSLNPLSSYSYSYQPFEDNNNSGSYAGYHDPGDFPNIALTPAPKRKYNSNIYNPLEFNIGFDMPYYVRYHLQGEFRRLVDRGDQAQIFSSLGDQISSSNHLNLGFIRFAEKIPRKWFHHLHFRSGIYLRSYRLKESDHLVIENGISLGIGFIFGAMNNQIDLAYSIGNRKDFNELGGEVVQRFAFGLSIGDIWFIKRRAR